MWKAKWIWCDNRLGTTNREHELVYFRRTFDVPADRPCSLVVHVTADSRYRLYLNGHSVSVGPAKGDNHTHYYETVDLTGRLKAGKNVLAVKVLHYAGFRPWKMGTNGPISVWRSDTGALLVEGILEDENGACIEAVHTDSGWKCMRDEGYSLVATPFIQWLGGLENVNGAKLPHGWQEIEFDDSAWANAAVCSDTHNAFGELSAWVLTPRPIPPLYERESRFLRVTQTEGVDIDDEEVRSILQQKALPLRVKPGTKVVLELDAGELTTGYLSLKMSGGAGAEVRLLCAECYEPEGSDPRRKRVKGIRDQAEGQRLIGEYDVYAVAGIERGNNAFEIYEPFSFRTFRFVRFEFMAADELLEVHEVGFRDTAYPLEVEGEFACSDSDLTQLWGLSLRTLQRCMHETYEDCPYYEQLQYTMDTRLQMLFTYQVSRDDRLARRAIHDFYSSMLPSGMLQCRYPSVYTQVIPSFSLYWIHMLHEHYTYFGDLQLVRRYLSGMIAVLDWFERHRTPEGIVGMTPPEYWTHFDWVQEWPGGAPPTKDEGPMILHSLMYAVALKKAGDLLEWIGWKEAASEYRERAEEVNQAVIRTAWSDEERYFSNSPKTKDFSQHPQVWAVLSGAIEGNDAVDLLTRTMQDSGLPVLSIPMTYHLFRALESVGMYEASFGLWDRWRSIIGLNMTTLPEVFHKTPRSDCHAWSAVPLAEFAGNILGVKPAEPGYKRIRVQPYPGPLTWAKGAVATKHGPVHVDWSLDNGQFRIAVKGPEHIPVELVLPDGTVEAFFGQIECVV